MQSGAILVAVAAASALLALTGCVPRSAPPAPPSAKQAVAHNQALLDATWTAEGLDGIVPKLTSSSHLAGDDLSGVFDCLGAAGFPGAAIASDGSSYSLAADSSGADGSSPTVAAKIALYTCLAEHPADPRRADPGQAIYSPAQLHYLWNYFTTWQIPCLELHGYTVGDVPARASLLLDEGTLWTPYARVNVSSSDTTLTDDYDRRMKQLRVMCGATLGVIDPDE